MVKYVYPENSRWVSEWTTLSSMLAPGGAIETEKVGGQSRHVPGLPQLPVGPKTFIKSLGLGFCIHEMGTMQNGGVWGQSGGCVMENPM